MFATRFRLLAISLIVMAWHFGPCFSAAAQGEDVIDVAKAIFKSIASTYNQKEDALFPATHEQTSLMEVLPKNDRQERQLACFCLQADGNLLAAITADPGEIRVMSPQGQLIDTSPADPPRGDQSGSGRNRTGCRRG